MCLGLGDSNYTRYMAVCRGIKRRFKDLGAQDLYKHKEADEVGALFSLSSSRRGLDAEPVRQAWSPCAWQLSACLPAGTA